MRMELTSNDVATARWAGLLYLVIIVCGIGAEVGLRGPLIDLSSAPGTAAAIRAAGQTFPLAIAADVVMALADAGLAILLYVLFRSVAPTLALAAMVFRLIQSALIAANLLNMQAAWLLITGDQDLGGLGGAAAEAMALAFLDLHAHGYDLGLFFFGINSVLTGMLIWKSGFFSKALGVGVAVAGAVYLIGSTLRFLAPDILTLFLPAYGLTLLAEGAFCIALLLANGLRRRAGQTLGA